MSNTIPIKTAEDFECVADDMISEFMQELNGSNFIKDIEEVDGYKTAFTDRAIRLYDSYCSKLKRIGERLFPDDVIRIKSSYIVWY